MTHDRQRAMFEFKRIMKWIVFLAVLMVAGALTFLHVFATLDTHMVIAVTFGVFFSMVLGCGLFAAAFFSDKSGHDASVDDSTRTHHDKQL
jgi:uncharacterized membrane protein YbjE (DUF340 family)